MTVRIAHVTTVHPRDDIRIFHKECVSLARAGHEVVQVVADGRGDAVVAGVRIVDVGAAPPGRIARMRAMPQRAWQAVRSLAPALVHVHDPELLGVAVSAARAGIATVYDAHEDLPRQILTKQWIPGALRGTVSRVAEWRENAAVRQLAALVAATPHIAARFAPVARQVATVANYPFEHELAPPAQPQPRERAVVYVGGITRTRGALQMVRAVAQLPGTALWLAGAMEDAALEAELRAEPGWAQTQWFGVVGRDGVRDLLARAAVGWCTLRPMPSYLDALPIKLFEYMSAQLPVVASHFPLWRDIVQGAGCGVLVDPDDPADIARATRELLDDATRRDALGRAGRDAVLQRYRWPAAEAELLALYRRLLAR